jgi:hypothetical protein
MRVDPWLPGICSSELICPKCGQTYEQILDGEHGLPERHYVMPIVTAHKPKRGQWYTRTNGAHIDGYACEYDADHLTALLFIAQREREMAA